MLLALRKRRPPPSAPNDKNPKQINHAATLKRRLHPIVTVIVACRDSLLYCCMYFVYPDMQIPLDPQTNGKHHTHTSKRLGSRDRHGGQKRCLALAGCNDPMTERRAHFSRTIRRAASQPARFVHAHALRWSEPATYHKAALCSICDAAVFVPLHLVPFGGALGLPPAPNARTGWVA